MAVARLLDVRHGDGIIFPPRLNQEHAVNWFRFLRHCASNGLCTIVASQWNGSGENFHDEANPLGENAFIYAEFDVGVKLFGILIQWADSDNFGTAPGNPGLLQGSASNDGVGIQFAIREDGTSPWAGTTGDTGANTKGTPVWTPGGSVVHVFPRSNNPGPPLGSHNTNKENMCLVGQDDTTGFNRAHWVANEDGIFQAFSLQDDGAYVGMYVGRYGVRTGLTLSNPYCMIWRNSSSFWADGPGTQYGGTTGNSSNNGGIIANDADGVMDASIGLVVSGQQDAVFSPNNLISPPEFEGGDISVFQRETTPGLAGFMPVELVAHFYGTSNQQTNAVADRAYIGNNTITTEKWGISWDGGAIPGTNNTRLGRLSYTP